MGNGVAGAIAIFTAITGVALVAVLVSKNSNTSGVLSSIGSAYAAALHEAVSPIMSSSATS